MDTFGRLPKKLLSNLEYLFLLPTIDILANYPPFYLTVYKLICI